MTSPSAQKAAGETAIKASAEIITRIRTKKTLMDGPGSCYQYAEYDFSQIIQQAITEAVDAVVAPKDKRVKELEAALETLAFEFIRDSREQKGYAVETVDADWTDHYGDLDRAFDDYWNDDSARADMIKSLVEGLR